jgi:hypothetical protein
VYERARVAGMITEEHDHLDLRKEHEWEWELLMILQFLQL